MITNWQTGIATHQGTKKEKNEDSYLYRITTDSDGNDIAMFVVADGMGGYQVGDRASRLAISSFETWWEKRIAKILKKKDVFPRILREGQSVFQQINQTIKTTSSQTGKKMGTTLSLLVLYQGEYAVVHIGDSRIYRMRGNQELQQQFQQYTADYSVGQQDTVLLESNPELLKLTDDHSWVDQKVKQGLITEEEARNHPNRNVLTQCLGIEEVINPYIHTGSYQSSDLFLVCSDGFHSLFSNDEIKHMLINLEKEYRNLQAVCDYLINFSNFSEAHDNITLLLIRNTYLGSQRKKEKKSLFSFLKSGS